MKLSIKKGAVELSGEYFDNDLKSILSQADFPHFFHMFSVGWSHFSQDARRTVEQCLAEEQLRQDEIRQAEVGKSAMKGANVQDFFLQG